MAVTIKMVYQEEPKQLSITCDDKVFDVSRIENLSMEQWGFPFLANGIKWEGLYQELKNFVGCDDFTILFEGDDTSYNMLEYILKDTPAKVTRKIQNATVTIAYSEEPFTTRIMINGKMFDTSQIQNRSIDEWLYPIYVRGVQWEGLFTELENYLHTDTYTISFIGESRFMDMLINQCPPTVQIFYRDPTIAQMQQQSQNTSKKKGYTGVNATTSSNNNTTSGNYSAGSTPNAATWPQEEGQRKFRRVRDGKVFAGVCNGIGQYFGINPWIIRIILIVLHFIPFVGLLAIILDIIYIILIFAIPYSDDDSDYITGNNINANYQTQTGERPPFRRVREGKILAGVCTGVARQLDIKPWVVRVILILLNFMVIGEILDVVYIVLIFAVPYDDEG